VRRGAQLVPTGMPTFPISQTNKKNIKNNNKNNKKTTTTKTY
jgi:hypothetical protein